MKSAFRILFYVKSIKRKLIIKQRMLKTIANVNLF